MKKTVRIAVIVLLFLMLIFIRGFVAPYFYDPLNEYFKNDYLYKTIPEIEFGTYFLHLFFRYLLNGLVSLVIIYLIVKNDGKLLLFVVKFYVAAFFLLSLFLFILLKYQITEWYMLIFYTRRFLIQPLFVFILLPAIYYQQLKVNN